MKTGISAQRAHEIALGAQRQWYERRTRPVDFSLSLFDGYTLLYLSKHELHFVEDQFSSVESVAAAQKARAESLQYVPEAVWSNMAEIS